MSAPNMSAPNMSAPNMKVERKSWLLGHLGTRLPGVRLLAGCFPALIVGLAALPVLPSRAESSDDWKSQAPPLDLFLQDGARRGANARPTLDAIGVSWRDAYTPMMEPETVTAHTPTTATRCASPRAAPRVVVPVAAAGRPATPTAQETRVPAPSFTGRDSRAKPAPTARRPPPRYRRSWRRRPRPLPDRR